MRRESKEMLKLTLFSGNWVILPVHTGLPYAQEQCHSRPTTRVGVLVSPENTMSFLVCLQRVFRAPGHLLFTISVANCELESQLVLLDCFFQKEPKSEVFPGGDRAPTAECPHGAGHWRCYGDSGDSNHWPENGDTW